MCSFARVLASAASLSCSIGSAVEKSLIRCTAALIMARRRYERFLDCGRYATSARNDRTRCYAKILYQPLNNRAYYRVVSLNVSSLGLLRSK